jgi:hypothetical protein
MAVPPLQLYIDGATYDPTTETWISFENDFDLYVIGNGNLSDVLVSMALSTPEGIDPNGDVSIDVNGSTYGSWTWGYAPLSNDPSVWDGGDDDLQTHGIYPAWYTEFSAGDFTEVGGIHDVQPPSTWNPTMGYIPGGNHLGEYKMYSISVTGDAFVHFDAYTTNSDGTINKFAPFSHDAGTGIPEPATMLLFGLGLAGAGVVRKLRK